MNSNESLRSLFDRAQQRALVIGGVGLVALPGGSAAQPDDSFSIPIWWDICCGWALRWGASPY